MKLTFENWVDHWCLAYRFLKGAEDKVRVEVWSEAEPVGCVWAEGDNERQAMDRCVEAYGSIEEV